MRRITSFAGMMLLVCASAHAACPQFRSVIWAGSPAGEGALRSPAAITRDASGHVYIAEHDPARILEFNGTGARVAAWGSPGHGPGEIDAPSAIAVGANGQLYVADRGNQRIARFTADGAALSAWGSAGTGPGEFADPAAMVADAEGSLFVVDRGNHRVQKFAPDGAFLRQWGAPGTGAGELSSPSGIAIDDKGHLYVLDAGNGRIEKFTRQGRYLTQWPLSAAGGLPLDARGIACDGAGNVYVNEAASHSVQIFTSRGFFLGSVPGPAGIPQGIAADHEGNLYVTDMATGLVHMLVSRTEAPGAFVFSIGDTAVKWLIEDAGPLATNRDGDLYVGDEGKERVLQYTSTGGHVMRWAGNAYIYQPVNGIAVDQAGDLFVTNNNHAVQKMSTGGHYETMWGYYGSGDGQFFEPSGLATDAAGSVYVADMGNRRIQKFANDGTYLLQWGSVGHEPGQFWNPWAVAADADGFVYVTDGENHRVEKFTGDGTYVTQWGVEGSGEGEFGQPFGITVDPHGDIYVADPVHPRIQKFTSNGAFLTQWSGREGEDGAFRAPRWVAADPSGSVYVSDGGKRVWKFAMPPVIESVEDRPNDEGRNVVVRFRRSSADAVGSGLPILRYDLYRRVSEAGAGNGPFALDPIGWERVGSIDPEQQDAYAIAAATTADAGPNSDGLTTFFVRAITQDPSRFLDSAPRCGWSEDDLAPPAPIVTRREHWSDGVHLAWQPSPAPDFAEFHLYRGHTPDFAPLPQSLVLATTDRAHIAPGPHDDYFKLTAVDRAGNESEPVTVAPDPYVDPITGAPFELALLGPDPHPARLGSLIRLRLPRATDVRLSLHDAAGRWVRNLASGSHPAGEYVLAWDSADAAGRRLAPGLYFLKLTAAGRVLTRRVVSLD